MPDLPVREETAILTTGVQPGLHIVTVRFVLTDQSGALKETFEPGESWNFEILRARHTPRVPPVYQAYWQD